MKRIQVHNTQILLFTLWWVLFLGATHAWGADSIQVVVDGDSLRLSRTWQIEYPIYQPDADSSARDTKKLASTNPPGNLLARGSMSRGIQFSTNASLSLQSSMYLKVDGQLNDDLRLEGTLSEKTSPLQPIGNTRRLNDFDRVLMTLKGAHLDASMGDLSIQRKPQLLAPLTRNVEGIQADYNNGSVQTFGAIGFSYGQTTRMEFNAVDGKQGPYRLSGKYGEKFIIVLAGSERVYLNGQALQRGEHDDYIMDYNAGEIRFTSVHQLAATDRISLEFEYVPDVYLADYSYGKQVLSAEFSWKGRSLPITSGIAYQRVWDDQNNPLGNADVDTLRGAFSGLSDTTSVQWRSTVVIDSLNGRYQLNENGDLTYDPNGTYSAQFNYVGLTEGRYRKVLSVDTVYYELDTLAGEYLPAKRLIAPGSHEVFSVHGQWLPGKWVARGEMGLSRRVQNLYSETISHNPNIAFLGEVEYNGDHLTLSARQKQYGEGFMALNPVESSESYREWQLQSRVDEAERIQLLEMGYSTSWMPSIAISSQRLDRGDQISGEKNALKYRLGKSNQLGLSGSHEYIQLQGKVRNVHQGALTSQLGPFGSKLSYAYYMGNLTQNFIPDNYAQAAISSTLGSQDRGTAEFTLAQRRDLDPSSYTGLGFDAQSLEHWTTLRNDVALRWKHTAGSILTSDVQLKAREKQSDSSAVSRYYLGSMDLSGSWFDDRLSFQNAFVLDEEHIPQYEYHYVRVDTGYGEWSYDPYLQDYVAVSGGTFIRQRLYSDLDEQVRTLENKGNVRIATANRPKGWIPKWKHNLSSRLKQQLQVESKATIQDAFQLTTGSRLEFDQTKLLQALALTWTQRDQSSTLNQYGSESALGREWRLESEMRPRPRQRLVLTAVWEHQARDLSYNPLAREDWQGKRLDLAQRVQSTTGGGWEARAGFSQISDAVLSTDYAEYHAQGKHTFTWKRRVRLQQSLEASYIQAAVESIPYSVFSGRQPGENWSYSAQGRMVFTTQFQLQIHYSIKQRGTANQAEQYLRLEGRTTF